MFITAWVITPNGAFCHPQASTWCYIAAKNQKPRNSSKTLRLIDPTARTWRIWSQTHKSIPSLMKEWMGCPEGSSMAAPAPSICLPLHTLATHSESICLQLSFHLHAALLLHFLLISQPYRKPIPPALNMPISLSASVKLISTDFLIYWQNTSTLRVYLQ